MSEETTHGKDCCGRGNHGAKHPGEAPSHPHGHRGPKPDMYHHPDVPRDPRDKEVDPAEVNARDNFSLHAVFALEAYLPNDEGERQRLAAAAQAAVEACGVELRGWYDVAGYRSDADLMFWILSDSADKNQAAFHALRSSELGSYLVPVWSAMCAHMPAEFNVGHLPACFGGSAPRGYLAVYPFLRTYDWYYLPKVRRAAMLKEHGMNGRDYLDVQISTLAAFALGDWEWTVSLEHDSLDRIMGCLRQQRDCEARLFVREDQPFYTGKRLELTEWIRLQPHDPLEN